MKSPVEAPNHQNPELRYQAIEESIEGPFFWDYNNVLERDQEGFQRFFNNGRYSKWDSLVDSQDPTDEYTMDVFQPTNFPDNYEMIYKGMVCKNGLWVIMFSVKILAVSC